MWDKMQKDAIPSLDDFSKYVRNPLWETLYNYMKSEYSITPAIEYSGCHSLPGWNVKFKKSGKNLCTFYPHEGFFIVLIVIGKKEKAQFEEVLPTLSPYIWDLYHNTKEGMGQRWLLIEFEDEYLFEDIKKMIAIRRGRK